MLSRNVDSPPEDDRYGLEPAGDHRLQGAGDGGEVL
jgi:hypothetical protein